jgi:lipid II:glycine glycyltransferase (peptidoglycan interpeptide bridge formation enzyme)
LYETLNQTKERHDEMAANWEDMEQQLRVSRATAAMEKKLRERNMEAIETEREQLAQATATIKEEMAGVRDENIVIAPTWASIIFCGGCKPCLQDV